MRKPSDYGQSRMGSDSPGICEGSASLMNYTYFALPVGCARLMISDNGMPIHGITIDYPSTHRNR